MNKENYEEYDGQEGSGKSTVGLQFCKYVDRVVFTTEEFRDTIAIKGRWYYFGLSKKYFYKWLKMWFICSFIFLLVYFGGLLIINLIFK